jgi:hypothetical protein
VSTDISISRARRTAAVQHAFGAAAELYPQADRRRLAGMTRTPLSRILPGLGVLALLFAQPGVSPAVFLARRRTGALARLPFVGVGSDL